MKYIVCYLLLISSVALGDVRAFVVADSAFAAQFANDTSVNNMLLSIHDPNTTPRLLFGLNGCDSHNYISIDNLTELNICHQYPLWTNAFNLHYSTVINGSVHSYQVTINAAGFTCNSGYYYDPPDCTLGLNNASLMGVWTETNYKPNVPNMRISFLQINSVIMRLVDQPMLVLFEQQTDTGDWIPVQTVVMSPVAG